MTLRSTTRRTWILAVAAALSIGVFVSPAVRHSHTGGDEPHSHSTAHPHSHSHGHGHTHAHHGHTHHSHKHLHAEGAEGRIRADASHVHISFFGFEITLFDGVTPKTARHSTGTSRPRRGVAKPVSYRTADTPPVLTRRAERFQVVELAVSGVNSLDGDWSDWAKYNVARRSPVLNPNDGGTFSRPGSETLPPQGSLKPPLPPPQPATPCHALCCAG